MVRYIQAPLVRVIDDDDSVQESLSFMLQIAGFEVRTYSSAEQFLNTDDKSRVGCAVIDVRMPQMTGLELQKEMKKRDIALPVIFLTGHGDIEMAVQALHDGALDFLVKPPEPAKLIEVCKKAIEKDKENRMLALERQEIETLMSRLTAAESEVAQLLAKGLTIKAMAEILGVGEQTVKVHRSNVYRKLDVINAVEVASIVNEYNRGRA